MLENADHRRYMTLVHEVLLRNLIDILQGVGKWHGVSDLNPCDCGHESAKLSFRGIINVKNMNMIVRAKP